MILPPEARGEVLLEDITHAFVVRGTLRKYLGHGMNFATIAEVGTYILKQAMILLQEMAVVYTVGCQGDVQLGVLYRSCDSRSH